MSGIVGTEKIAYPIVCHLIHKVRLFHNDRNCFSSTFNLSSQCLHEKLFSNAATRNILVQNRNVQYRDQKVWLNDKNHSLSLYRARKLRLIIAIQYMRITCSRILMTIKRKENIFNFSVAIPLRNSENTWLSN